MKNYKLILIGLFLLSIYSFAQPPHLREKKEQIKSLKIAYITTELSLSSSEAANFWPLYNAYDNKQNELRRKKIKSFIDKIDVEEIGKISEKDASALLAQSEIIEEEMFQNRKKFISSLKDILPSIKIIKLKKTEDDFNKKLLQQYRDRKPRN